MKNKIKTAVTAATAIAGTAVIGTAGKKIKEKTFCPICSAKKLIGKARLTQTAEFDYNNGTALTPPMGWSSWNLFRHKISEDLIKEIIDAMDKSGLKDAGYTYVNIDDCWQSSSRDDNGRLQCNKLTFPSGIKALTQYANSKGIKLGIYSSNGTHTCEDYPASLRHERMDAETFAEWGVEYFKYDFCHNEKISSEAPKIITVSVAKPGSGKPFARFDKNNLTLKGLARIVPDEKVSEKYYIDGLSARNGSIYFEVEADSDGDYVLDLNIRKIDAKNDRFLMVKVNGKDEYHIYSVGRKNWTPDGNLQETIRLNKGVNTIELSNPVGSGRDSAAIQYKLMGRELKRATKKLAEENGTQEKPIVYSICEWGRNSPWKWGAEAGNLWRTTPDIGANWPSILGLYEATVRLYKYSRVGAWNDPDMLEVGNGNLTVDENISHFSLWCMMNAPLILGNDIRKFIKADGSVDSENIIYKILTNKKMISVNQDALGVQCRRIKKGLVDVLVKPLVDGKAAVCIFNKGKKEKEAYVEIKDLLNLSYLNLSAKSSYKITDVWQDSVTENICEIKASVPGHGVKVYIIE
ncbi:MAG: alpha-galactosidase [Acutalibacteraceae bacterium]